MSLLNPPQLNDKTDLCMTSGKTRPSAV